MDNCPDEVLVKVCDRLDFEDVANLRLVNKHLAEVGAEALIKRVRFHCTQESLKRLYDIGHDPVFCRHVESVVFEGNLLAQVPCVSSPTQKDCIVLDDLFPLLSAMVHANGAVQIHTYQQHYQLDHHAGERPPPLPKSSTPREKRLHERHVAQFNRELEKKYMRYLDLYNKQQKVIYSPTAYAETIDPTMLRFPRLTKIALSTVGRCKHVLSGRFLDSFTADCSMPIELDSKHTKDQLKHLLLPHDQPLTGLLSLELHAISPKFFTGFVPKDMVCRAFQSLKVVDLNFRLEKEDRVGLDFAMAKSCYLELGKGALREALSSANELQQLTVNFDDYGYYGAVTSLENILGNKVWPNLSTLNLDCMSASEDYLVAMLKRQSYLRDLRLGFMTLEQGSWPHATTRMRKGLSLTNFDATGIFEDCEQMYPMHLLDGDVYAQEFRHVTLSDALGLWVTDGADLPEDDDYHPLKDDEFTDEEELREQYGPFADDEDFSDMDCDSD